MSEQARPDLSDLTPVQSGYVRNLESMVGARSISVSRNGRFPLGWSFERWMSLLTFLTVVIGGIWFAGGEWQGLKMKVAMLDQNVASAIERMKTLNEHQSALQRQVDAIEPAPAGTRSRPPGVFSRDEQFMATPPRQGERQ